MTATLEDRELAIALSELYREVHALYSEIARRFGLSTPQAQLLCSLARSTPTSGELASQLGCDKTNVTGMVDRLARRELVTREKDPADRRISRVVLTDSGSSLVEDIRTAFATTVAERCGPPHSDSIRFARMTAEVLGEARIAAN